MSVSLEPVDVPESETTPVEEPQISENVETPTDVVEEPPVAIESEGNPTTYLKGIRSVEAPVSKSAISTTCNSLSLVRRSSCTQFRTSLQG